MVSYDGRGGEGATQRHCTHLAEAADSPGQPLPSLRTPEAGPTETAVCEVRRATWQVDAGQVPPQPLSDHCRAARGREGRSLTVAS